METNIASQEGEYLISNINIIMKYDCENIIANMIVSHKNSNIITNTMDKSIYQSSNGTTITLPLSKEAFDNIEIFPKYTMCIKLSKTTRVVLEITKISR